jgi:hypothetical protein
MIDKPERNAASTFAAVDIRVMPTAAETPRRHGSATHGE